MLVSQDLDVVQQHCRGTLGCLLAELPAHRWTAPPPDKGITPRCVIGCIAKTGARLLCPYVTMRITISNSLISFAGGTWELGLRALESHLTGHAVTALHIKFHVFYTHLCGDPWDASASGLCSLDIHKRHALPLLQRQFIFMFFLWGISEKQT